MGSKARYSSLSSTRLIQSPSLPSSYFLKRHFNIILPATPVSSKCSLYLGFLHQNLCAPLLVPIRATCPAYLIRMITQILFGEVCRSETVNESGFILWE